MKLFFDESGYSGCIMPNKNGQLFNDGQRHFVLGSVFVADKEDEIEMDMYIRMYDELKRSEGDNPTIGIVLCSDTDDDIARYSVMHGNEQLFASKYKLYLPTKEELKAEIETQKAMFYLQQQDNEEKETE